MSRFLMLIALAMFATPLVAQVELFDIDTFSVHPVLNPDAPDYTFGIEIDPDGVHAWATVSGALGAPGSTGFQNNRLLKIDLNAGTIVDQALVGFFPEDVVLRLDSAGATETIFVTNTSDGTVTALSAGLVVLGTANLGNCFGSFPHFPFEMALSADQSKLYVGSNCQGDLFELDADPSSATFLNVSVLSSYGESHNTLDLIDPNTLVVGGSLGFFDAMGNFSGSRAVIDFVDLSGPMPLVTTYNVGSPRAGDFASVTDVLPLPDGQLLVVENSQTRANLIIFDPVSRSVVDRINLHGNLPSLAFLHQADVESSGRLLVLTSLLEDLIFFDLESRNIISRITYAGQAQPSVARFTNDETRVVCSFQNEESVRVLGSLPQPLEFQFIGTGQVGSAAGLRFEQAAPFDAVAALFSATGAGPTLSNGFVFALDPSFGIFSLLPSNAMGIAEQLFGIPNDPNLVGLVAYFQGITAQPANRVRLSNPVTVSVLP